MNPPTKAVGAVLLVCVGVRVAAAIIEPVLPAVIVIAVLVLILSRLIGGPRSRKDWP